jgi:hypothetical protein
LLDSYEREQAFRSIIRIKHFFTRSIVGDACLSCNFLGVVNDPPFLSEGPLFSTIKPFFSHLILHAQMVAPQASSQITLFDIPFRCLNAGMLLISPELEEISWSLRTQRRSKKTRQYGRKATASRSPTGYLLELFIIESSPHSDSQNTAVNSSKLRSRGISASAVHDFEPGQTRWSTKPCWGKEGNYLNIQSIQMTS